MAKTLVYLLDSELASMDDVAYSKLADYCKKADLVVFDAAYTSEDYPLKKGWGHSTVADAAKLHQNSGCKQILLTHFHYTYDDQNLTACEAMKEQKIF